MREVLAVEASLKEMLLQEQEYCKTSSEWEENIKQNNKANELRKYSSITSLRHFLFIRHRDYLGL